MLPSNWPTVSAFLSIAENWRTVQLVTGRTHWQGLDYTGIVATPEMWPGLRVMEAAARNELNGANG